MILYVNSFIVQWYTLPIISNTLENKQFVSFTYNGPKVHKQFRYTKMKLSSAYFMWKGESSWLNKERK